MTYIPTSMIPTPRKLIEWKDDLEIGEMYVFNGVRRGIFLILKEINDNGCIFQIADQETIIFKYWDDPENLYKIQKG